MNYLERLRYRDIDGIEQAEMQGRIAVVQGRIARQHRHAQRVNSRHDRIIGTITTSIQIVVMGFASVCAIVGAMYIGGVLR